jgi:hypothetical protein
MQLEIEFKVISTVDIPDATIQQWAEKNDYNWDDEEERQEAIEEWVADAAYPSAYYADYSGKRMFVQLDKDIQGVEYDIPEESIISVKVEG